MQRKDEKQLWMHYDHQYSPETTIFDTYLEEHKSRSSTPNTIIHKSPIDLKSELLNTIETLQSVNNEEALMKQAEKYELRKNLLNLKRNNLETLLHRWFCNFFVLL